MVLDALMGLAHSCYNRPTRALNPLMHPKPYVKYRYTGFSQLRGSDCNVVM